MVLALLAEAVIALSRSGTLEARDYFSTTMLTMILSIQLLSTPTAAISSQPLMIPPSKFGTSDKVISSIPSMATKEHLQVSTFHLVVITSALLALTLSSWCGKAI